MSFPGSFDFDQSPELELIEKESFEHSQHSDVSKEYTDSQQSSHKFMDRQPRQTTGMKAESRTSRMTKEYERALAKYWNEKAAESSQEASTTLRKLNSRRNASRSHRVKSRDVPTKNYITSHRKA